MSWGEAFRLTVVLAGDPSSRVAASVAGWKYPLSRSELVLMDLLDQTKWSAWSGKGARPKQYPRPWPAQTTRKVSVDPSLTREDVVAALRYAGHTGPIPAHLGGDDGSV